MKMSETKKKEYKTEEYAPSDMFIDAVASEGGHGSYDMECGWCGRMHYCPEVKWGWSDEDREDAKNFKEYAENCYKENPEGVVLHYDSDAVSGVLVNDINFVLCCPCNGLRRYETFIWHHRGLIRNYLKTRIDHETDLALQEKTLNKLAGVDKKVKYDGTWE